MPRSWREVQPRRRRCGIAVGGVALLQINANHSHFDVDCEPFGNNPPGQEFFVKHLVLAAALGAALSFSASVQAKADCKAYPKSEWMKEADAKAKIEAQGYKIDKFKVDGNCYEIYGRNKEGKKVEIYYDAKTLEPVKTEIEK